jgi:hypothetical protein
VKIREELLPFARGKKKGKNKEKFIVFSLKNSET